MAFDPSDPFDNTRNEEWIIEHVEASGPITASRNVAPEELATWRGKLPDILLDIWNKFGLIQTYGGLIQWCLPEDMSRVVDLVLKGDREFDASRIYPYAYSAFGEIYCWSPEWRRVRINLVGGTVWVNQYFNPKDRYNANLNAISAVEKATPEHHDAWDEDEKPLFDRAVAALGVPDFGECFGFFPALSMGGAARLENLRRVKALEHFTFLAQTQEFMLTGLMVPPQDMLPIGASRPAR